jgi:hypothetical protein
MATTWQPADARVFHYGFLSSRASEALTEYLDTGTTSDDSLPALEQADAFLQNILLAQAPFGQKEAAAPTESALDAFGCALEVIVAHRAEFEVDGWPQLSHLFDTLHRTLHQMVRREMPRREDVERTRAFFRRFASLMLAQVSVPEEIPVHG